MITTRPVSQIGLSLCDVNLACSKLGSAGLHVSQPAQFQDIGYVAHLTDPAGYTIELLQHRFEKHQVPTETPDTKKPLGQAVWMGQITLRWEFTLGRTVAGSS